MAKIRLLIVDDHPIICDGLEFLLNQDPGLLVLGSAVDVLKGLAMVRKWRPDLVVLDISMPGYNGMEAISFYRDAHPQIRIVIFSARCEEKYVHQSLRAGANGYVLKGASPTELQQAIHYIMAGGYWLSPQFNQKIIANYLNPGDHTEVPEDSLFGRLTEREKQVLLLMAKGKETDEIAGLLNISKNTVAKHRSSLLRKLKVNNAVEMTRLAIRHGLINP